MYRKFSAIIDLIQIPFFLFSLLKKIFPRSVSSALYIIYHNAHLRIKPKQSLPNYNTMKTGIYISGILRILLLINSIIGVIAASFRNNLRYRYNKKKHDIIQSLKTKKLYRTRKGHLLGYEHLPIS